MIVDADTLDVRPVTDELLKAVCGSYEQEILPDGEGSPIAWSNELVLHVVELKTADPVASLHGLGDLFHQHVKRINALLAPMNCLLLPGAMHPWMDPHTQMKLWPHHSSEIYEAFDRIFDCRGHGWANLQSTHLNLPFADDDEFGRLHAAVRLLLPLIPALAAGSPIMDGRVTGTADNRLAAYRHNARRVPSVTGRVIPEAIYSRVEYQNVLLQGIYRDLAPLDPQGILRYEWVNARGAIARFDRGSIELRLIDVQECPAADEVVLKLIVAAIQALTEQRWVSLDQLNRVSVDVLADLLDQTTIHAESAQVGSPQVLRCFGCDAAMTAGDLWRRLQRELLPHVPLPAGGTLAQRMITACGPAPDRQQLTALCRQLAHCLAENQPFAP
ncbi:MAG: glutamate--cysteine ligase [Phycisphaeraceae bacterium]|nr:glutamate--cysteine ligase [Phycisphaeraceae bacterium]